MKMIVVHVLPQCVGHGAVAAKLKAGEITKEEYDRWRYRYPELDTSGQWHKITPSQELSDLLLADLKEHSEE